MKFKFLFSVFLATLALFSCSGDEDLLLPEETGTSLSATAGSGGVLVSRMVMDASLQDFDQPVTRAVSNWEDGAEVYIEFSNYSEPVRVKAVYDASEGTWYFDRVFYLNPTSSSSCAAYYFKGSSTMNDSILSFSSLVGIYGAEDGAYSFEVDEAIIYMQVKLKPLTGRMRFKGEAGHKFLISGLDKYASYNLKTGKLVRGGYNGVVTIGSNGYSSYIYGLLDETTPAFSVIRGGYGYRLFCDDEILAIGKSGYIDVPTEASHDGWTRSLNNIGQTITLGANLSFRMIQVLGGTFTMGATPEMQDSCYSNEIPTHSVSLSSYLIGETEVTQEIWTAVMGSSPSSFTYGTLPVYGVTWTECQEFIEKLNQMTGRTFSLPTEAQWEFAARGGLLASSCRYAGSNEIDKVAWYAGNSASNCREVKKKAANELGIYDMTGNVWEWCSDWFAYYSGTALTNPIGPTSGTMGRVARGASAISTENDCRISMRLGVDPNLEGIVDVGLRLVLNQ